MLFKFLRRVLLNVSFPTVGFECVILSKLTLYGCVDGALDTARGKQKRLCRNVDARVLLPRVFLILLFLLEKGFRYGYRFHLRCLINLILRLLHL